MLATQMLGSGDSTELIRMFTLKSAFRTKLVRPFELEKIKGIEVKDKPLYI